MSTTNPHENTVRRACLPELMLSGDLALALELPEEQAETLARSGRLGPCVLVKGRPAILRRDFLAAIAGRTSAPPDDREVLP